VLNSEAVEQCNEPDEVVANGPSPSQVIAVFYGHARDQLVGVTTVLGRVGVVLSGLLATQCMFEFPESTDPTNLLTVRDSGAISSFSVATPSGTTLWKIQRSGGAQIEKIEYGVIPSGFQQDTPVGGSPRSLVDDEPLKTRIESALWWCEHFGRARGSRGFQRGGWECGRANAQASTRGVDQWAIPR
jgi:hypothetical protein